MPGVRPDSADPAEAPARRRAFWPLVLAASLLINALGAGLFVYRRYIRASERPAHYQTSRDSLFAGLGTRAQSIVMLGDSLMDWCEWHELLGRPEVLNRGVNRSTVKDLIARVDAVLAGRPAAIFIMAGINDLIAGAPVAEVAGRYRALIERIATRSPTTRVVVHSVLPTNRDLAPDAPAPETIQALNAQLRGLCNARSRTCTYLPLFARFADPRGQLARRFTVDGIHLNHQGYALWRDALMPLL